MKRHWPITAVASFFLVVGRLDAQQRRSAGGENSREEASAPLTIPDVPRDPAHPLVGVWIGQFRPGEPGASPAPYTVVIEYLNDGYTGYTFVGPVQGRPAPMRHPTGADRTIQWQQPNSGGGTLVFKGTVDSADRLTGTLTFRDFALPDGTPPPPATFALERRIKKP